MTASLPREGVLNIDLGAVRHADTWGVSQAEGPAHTKRAWCGKGQQGGGPWGWSKGG